ncbi:putative reverse transcriptase domain-containing protein [Tanacetum coccineum]
MPTITTRRARIGSETIVFECGVQGQFEGLSKAEKQQRHRGNHAGITGRKGLRGWKCGGKPGQCRCGTWGLPPTGQVEFQIDLVLDPVSRLGARSCLSREGVHSGCALITGKMNKLTVKNRYPLPRIDDLFDQLQGSSVYSKIDLRIRISPMRFEQEEFRRLTSEPLWSFTEYPVMPFGLTTHLLCLWTQNRVCKPHLDKFVIVFIDDILIYSKSKQEHEKHLKIILELLKNEELYAKFSKCEFWIPKVQFLGHVIDSKGIHVDPAKIEIIKDWASPNVANGRFVNS